MTAGMEAGLRHRLRRALRQMEAQHRQLRPILRDLQRAAEQSARDRIREELVRFTEALSAHFDLEGKTVFPAIRGLVPTTERDIRALVRDHHDLLKWLLDLRESLATEAMGAERLDEFSRALQDHEAREEELMAVAIQITTA